MNTKLKVILTAIGVSVAMQLSTVVYAESSYSSVAGLSGTSGGWAYGSYLGAQSRHNADVGALNSCHREARSRNVYGQCHVEYRFRGEGCVAIAKSDDGAGGYGAYSGYSNNQSAARNRAISECNSKGSGCYVISTGCANE